MEWVVHVAYRVLVVKPEGKRLLGKPAHILSDNMKEDSKKMGMRACGLD
jgi:hypothetical protein